MAKKEVLEDNLIKQEDGKARKFNTVIDALNFWVSRVNW